MLRRLSGLLSGGGGGGGGGGVRWKVEADSFLDVCQRGKRDEAERRLQDDGSLVSFCDENRVCALHIVCERGNEKLLALLLDAGADPEARDAEGTTPLLYAVYGGSLACVRALLRLHVDVNCSNRYGSTPLHWAAHHKRWDAVCELATYGAEERRDADGKLPADYCDTPKHRALYEKQYAAGACALDTPTGGARRLRRTGSLLDSPAAECAPSDLSSLSPAAF